MFNMTKNEKIEAIKNRLNSLENLFETKLEKNKIIYTKKFNKNGSQYFSLYSVFRNVAFPTLDEHVFRLPQNKLLLEYERRCSELINEKIASIEELSGLEVHVETHEYNTIYVNSDLVDKYKEGALDTDAIYKKVVEVIISLKDDFEKEYNNIISEAERNMDIDEMFSGYRKNPIVSYGFEIMYLYQIMNDSVSLKSENRTYHFFNSDIRILKIMEKYDLVDLNSVKENINDIWRSVGAVFVEDKDNNFLCSGFYYDGRINDKNGLDDYEPFEMKTDNNKMLFEIFDKVHKKNCELSKGDELSIDDIEHIVEETYDKYSNDLQNDEKSDI